MDLLILLTYAGFAIAVFKVFKVPVNGYTIVTAALGGFALLATLLLLMNYNHPFTQTARFYYLTTPIVPQVSGKVVEVAVSDAQQVKAGDELFRINPTPYENTVNQKKAQLADAKQGALALDTDFTGAREAYEAALAERDAASDLYKRMEAAVKTGSVSEAEFEKRKQAFLAADSQADNAKASMERAELASLSKIEGVNTEVARLEAELATAEFELSETTVRAPTDGTVLQVFLRPGMMAVSLPLRPVMIFYHAEKPFFVASFLQNSAQRIEEGSEAEVILPAAPGRIFKGKVSLVGATVPQGQLQPSGDLIDPLQTKGEGRINVVIEFDKDEFEGFQIVPGSTGQAAIYTHHFHHVAVMRKVLLRMKSWMNYVFSDGH